MLLLGRVRAWLSRCPDQLGQADEVVGRGGHREHPMRGRPTIRATRSAGDCASASTTYLAGSRPSQAFARLWSHCGLTPDACLLGLLIAGWWCSVEHAASHYIPADRRQSRRRRGRCRRQCDPVTVGTGPFYGKGGVGSAVPVAEVGRVSTYQGGQPGQPCPSWCGHSAILNMPRQHELPPSDHRRVPTADREGSSGSSAIGAPPNPGGALRGVRRHTGQTSNGAQLLRSCRRGFARRRRSARRTTANENAEKAEKAEKAEAEKAE
jgi:hypothetical protein